ncbi:MAG: hypothetical protein ABIL68_04965 [bacterium]
MKIHTKRIIGLFLLYAIVIFLLIYGIFDGDMELFRLESGAL